MGMGKLIIPFPEVLPVSPLSLPCPRCKAKPGKDCHTVLGGLSLVHVERIEAAAKRDATKKPKREDFSPAAARIVR